VITSLAISIRVLVRRLGWARTAVLIGALVATAVVLFAVLGTVVILPLAIATAAGCVWLMWPYIAPGSNDRRSEAKEPAGERIGPRR
jgi:hypothetical protein